MRAKIIIACVLPIPNDPTSFYRGIGPFAALTKTHPNVQLTFPQGVDWSSFILSDLVFLQRPATPEHFGALCLAKDLKKPVIVDFDDDNLSVPKDNPTYLTYNQLHIKDAIVKLARHCDALITSTEFLKKKYGIYNKNTFVVPNALDDNLMHLRQIPPGPRHKKLLWRGTSSHQRNLMSIGRELINLSRKHEEWKFTFFGVDPIDLTDQIKNHEIIGQLPILDFYKTMCVIHASALYYPLGATDHAQARSHISWLEATFAGCLTVASKNEEFTRPGVLNFSSPQAFEEIMDTVMSGSIDIDKRVQESWDEIQSRYMLSHSNALRMNVIESVL